MPISPSLSLYLSFYLSSYLCIYLSTCLSKSSPHPKPYLNCKPLKTNSRKPQVLKYQKLFRNCLWFEVVVSDPLLAGGGACLGGMPRFTGRDLFVVGFSKPLTLNPGP